MVGRLPSARAHGGYTLVALVILVAVMNVLVAAVLPLWTQAVQREKEEELIFRGLQYAEAIRVFQLRNGRLPVRLEELLEVKPRSIRQLWRDPFNEEGGWGLILAAQGAGGQTVAGGTVAQRQRQRQVGRDRQGQVVQDEPIVGLVDPARGGGRRRGRQATGPIVGVHSLAENDAIKSFAGGSSYKDWRFTTDLLPVAGGPAGGENTPRLNSRWVGRPFPEGVEPQEGGMPEGLEDREDEEDDRRGRSRRSRPGQQRPGGQRRDG